MIENLESNDRLIVSALLRHDPKVTRDFFYRKCYPLFKSVFDNYHTDCTDCLEFINEIYLHVMQPDKETGECKLAGFKFQSTLFTWLKTVCVFYCYKRFDRKSKMPTERIAENFDDDGVRLADKEVSIQIEASLFVSHDVDIILGLMPNKRYSKLIRLRYIDNFTNEETAAALGMNMNTFYNKHKLAKDQLIKILKMEENYHG